MVNVSILAKEQAVKVIAMHATHLDKVISRIS